MLYHPITPADCRKRVKSIKARQEAAQSKVLGARIFYYDFWITMAL
jgi:hypothetical protein